MSETAAKQLERLSIFIRDDLQDQGYGEGDEGAADAAIRLLALGDARRFGEPEPTDPDAALASAFVAALGELSNPGKDQRADVRSPKGNYSYEYAGLDAILDGVRPVLARHGLALSQPFSADRNGLVTVQTKVMHRLGKAYSGEPIERVVEGGPQEIGSFVTYARRYAIVALLGIHPAGEDDDAAAAQPVDRRPDRTAPGLPDPLIGGLTLSERTDDALRKLVEAPPSQKVRAQAQAHLDQRAREAGGSPESPAPAAATGSGGAEASGAEEAPEQPER